MDRRDFFKISALTGATAALDSCGKPERQLIRFIPEEDLVPGVATWKPSICTLCPAGCGLIVKVMEGEAEVVRNGKLGLMPMGLAKKLEGNPNHPVNQGKLCPRGQAGLQLTYHPDRIKTPLKRSGERGSGEFQEIGWDEAIKELAAQLSALQSSQESASLAFLTSPLRGQRRELVERFLAASGAPRPTEWAFLDDAVLRRANQLSFGRPQLPTFDLAHANYVISFGADFLGTWNSPVAQSIAYGEMRQGRSGRRAKFVMVEPRVSLTGANADEWISARPGTEGVLALGVAHVIIGEKLRPASGAGGPAALIEGWPQGLPDFSPDLVEKRTGVPAATITRIAREMAGHEPAIAMIAGAPLAETNGLWSAMAVNALNALLGSVGQPGGVLFTPDSAAAPPKPSQASREGLPQPLQALAQQALSGRPNPVKALLVHDANPVFASPPAWRIREAIENVPFVASLGSFLDETSILADLILPDHSPLESWLDDVPESGTMQLAASVAPPAMLPLHSTRAMPDVLLDIARQLGGPLSAALPWKSFDEMLHAGFVDLGERLGTTNAKGADDFWKKVQAQGGFWATETKLAAPKDPNSVGRAKAVAPSDPQFQGDEQGYPFYFLPYASQMLYDGSLAHLPWMQETPDPLSTAMWGTWVEINPKTAARLGIRQGDLLEVASQHGKLRAPALIYPGIAPDVIAMPIGQGHESFTRYASTRGANPISILAPLTEPETGSLAWAATRVKISRVGEGKLTLFGGGLSRFPHEIETR
ncbi:MAG TPA: molybdopterin-dependent oxidoreductase [Terriglobia bacterium]|nr:molybdopterin-dependent oxidoreductase [Terriglobia bacterium]